MPLDQKIQHDEQQSSQEGDAPPPYTFGPIEDKRSRIVGLVLGLNEKLPEAVDDLVNRVLGVPTISGDGVRIWRLTSPLSYIDDEWRWLRSALEWQADEVDSPVSFTECFYDGEIVEVLSKTTGPEFDFYSDSATDLIGSYRDFISKTTIETKAPKDEKGFQRLLYRAWSERNPELKPVERLTLFAVLRYCWSRDRCEVWETTLAEDVGCDVRTLQRALGKLVKLKYLRVENRHRKKSIYQVLRKDLIPPYPKGKSGKSGLSD